MGHNQGIRSKNVTQKPVRTGVGARAIDKKWVSQIGESMGNKVMRKSEPLRGVRAYPYKGPSFKPAPLGNTLVNNIGAGGPGKGRVLYGQSGLQGTHGPVNPGQSPARRDTLAEYGSDSANVRNRRS